MSGSTIEDVVDTAFRHAQEILASPHKDREPMYGLYFQVIRERALLWSFSQTQANELASNVTAWVREVVAAVERTGGTPRELRLPGLMPSTRSR